MNRFWNPRQFTAFSGTKPFPRIPKGRGVLEPMSRMSMDFQGRYMDSKDRELDPIFQDIYRMYHTGGQHFPGFSYSAQFFNYNPSAFNGGHPKDGYVLYGRRIGRNYPGSKMDFSNYQMDMQGRWMDKQGRYTNPFFYDFPWARYTPSFSPLMFFNRRFFAYPERFRDMSNLQMDMQGRWMDMQGRYTNPFNMWAPARQGPFPGYPQSRNIFNPEQQMDMSNYQMDMQGRWMDMQGRYTNPFNMWAPARQGLYSSYFHGPHMFGPGQMDMSKYQMDMQGRWMDMQGRYTNPFTQLVSARHSLYPGYFHGPHIFNPEPIDMSKYQMDMQGRWMDMQGRYTNPFNQRPSTRQGPYSSYSHGPHMFGPGQMDMSNYQMDMQGRWMDMQGHYTDPLNSCGPRRPGFNSESSYVRHMYYPERHMDMSNYQMDMQGRWMDIHGRYVDPFSSRGRQMRHPGGLNHFYGRHMNNPERYMDMSNYQMDMQGRWMDKQGRYTNPFNQWLSARQSPFFGYQRSTHMFTPDRQIDMSKYQMDMQGRWMDMQGRYTNPFNLWLSARQGPNPGNPQGPHIFNPEPMDMSKYQMDMQGRWMDMQGRYTNPFNQWGPTRQGPYPGYPHCRNTLNSERPMDMSNYQMDLQGHWMDMQGRYTNPFNQWGSARHGPYFGNPQGHSIFNPEMPVDIPNHQMDIEGRFVNPYCQPGHSSQGFHSSHPNHRNIPWMDMQGNRMDYHGHFPDNTMGMFGTRFDTPGDWMGMRGHPYCHPFNQYGYNRESNPGFYNNLNLFHPEQQMDMSSYQMDMQGRWMDMQGRYTDPFNLWGPTRQGPYPRYPQSQNALNPETPMDMSNYQMDLQGHWMDTEGRYTHPYYQTGYNRQGMYPGYSSHHNMSHQERLMDMSKRQMDMQGRWMDMQGRYTSPFNQRGSARQGPYPGFPQGHHMFGPERQMDMSNYQMDMQGRWMDMQGRYTNPFNQLAPPRQSSNLGYPPTHNALNQERPMDMSNYQVDMQGRSMDSQGRYMSSLFNRARANFEDDLGNVTPRQTPTPKHDMETRVRDNREFRSSYAMNSNSYSPHEHHGFNQQDYTDPKE